MDDNPPDRRQAVRGRDLHELLAVLSLAGNVANGLPFETGLRTCVVAVRLAEVAGLGEPQRQDVWHAAVLRFLGCTAFARDEAGLFGGDDVAVRRIFHPVEPTRASEVLPAAWEALAIGVGSRALRLPRVALALPKLRVDLAAAASDVGRRLADRLGCHPAGASPSPSCTSAGMETAFPRAARPGTCRWLPGCFMWPMSPKRSRASSVAMPPRPSCGPGWGPSGSRARRAMCA